MCGICGKIAFNPEMRSTEDELAVMRDTLTLRGPDDSGTYVNGNVALCHRRLSIIDLEGSRQPLSNEDGSIWIVYNGEVYNFLELREDLMKLGHRFKTRGDTEVIVHLYEQYGEQCLKKIRGMFAFAIWDEKKGELFLARDRLGVKPLHYYHDENFFIFGSEIKAILADKYYSGMKAMDLNAFHYYFSFLYVPAPLTIFKGIMKLLPAHWLKLTKSGKVETRKYWDVRYGSKDARLSENLYREKLQDLLREVVKIRLIADVPLGAFLSGGIDSSSVVATMAQISNSPIKTFSIGFSDERYDETDYAAEVARHFGTDHTEVVLEPNDILTRLDELILYFDEPFADSSLVPTYLVSRLAREKVKVVLSGDGGDELFGGYPWWQKRPRYQVEMTKLPRGMKSFISSLAPALPKGIKGRHFLMKLQLPYERYLLETKAVFDSEDRFTIYSKNMLESLSTVDPYEYNLPYLGKDDGQEWSNRIMEYDLKTYIPNDIMTKVDRMSMICSLEAREPLLDHKLVEFVAQIPVDFKIRGNISKYILKRTMDGVLPRRILQKPKHGFSVPLERWMRGELRDRVLDTVLSHNCALFFNKKSLEKMIQEFLSGNDDHKHRLWVLYTFLLWHSAHFS